MTVARSVADVLADHVMFEVESIDRMYLNVWQPRLAPGPRRWRIGVMTAANASSREMAAEVAFFDLGAQGTTLRESGPGWPRTPAPSPEAIESFPNFRDVLPESRRPRFPPPDVKVEPARITEMYNRWFSRRIAARPDEGRDHQIYEGTNQIQRLVMARALLSE